MNKLSKVHTTQSNQTNNERLTSLDGLRGLAACAVAFFVHASVISSNVLTGTRINVLNIAYPFPLNRIAEAISDFGAVGVDLFFVISGFVFCLIYRRSISERRITLKKFALMRFSRLYPAYWLALVVAFISFLIFVAVLGNGVVVYERASGIPVNLSRSIFSFLQSIPLVQGFWTTKRVTTFVGPAWSLSYELAVYLVFFAVTWFNRGKRGAIIYVLLLLFGVMLAEFGSEFGAERYMGWNAGRSRALIGFFSGCVLCLLNGRLSNSKTKKRILTAVCVLIVILIPMAALVDVAYYGNVYDDYTLFAPICSLTLFPALIFLVLNIKFISKFLSLPLFRWLGDLSYSMYIWHAPVYFAFAFIITVTGVEFKPWNYWLCVFVVLVVSHLSHYYFEIPMQNYIRRKYESSSKKE